MKGNNQLVIFILIIAVVVVLVYAFGRCKVRCANFPEKYRYDGGIYKNECEFNEACLWDTARWVQLSDGREGVCTLHGKACPAFSKDHTRSAWYGMSPDMVGDVYNDILKQNEDYSGETALELGM